MRGFTLLILLVLITGAGITPAQQGGIGTGSKPMSRSSLTLAQEGFGARTNLPGSTLIQIASTFGECYSRSIV